MQKLTNDDFWNRVQRTDSCWIWQGYRDKKGRYGKFAGEWAHRISYRLMVGPIPKGLTLDHLCRVRECVNPAHLEPVTLTENFRRALVLKTHCAQGHLFEGDNVYVRKNGYRMCRVCRRERMNAAYHAGSAYTKRINVGENRCSLCQQKGHNRRSCLR